MEKLKIGFVPSHRVPFDEDWAISMRSRVIEQITKNLKEIELIIPDATVTPGGILQNEEDAKKIIRYFKGKEIKGLLLGTMTFGEELPTISVAEEFRDIPIFLFGTKEGPFTSDGSRQSDSFCGTISIAHGLLKRNIKFYFGNIYFPEEDNFVGDLKNFIRIVNIFDNFYQTRVGLVGPRPSSFETCSINEDDLIEKFGIRVITYSLLDLYNDINNIDDKDIKVINIVNSIKSKCDCSKVGESTLIKSAKLEITLLNFAQRENLSCMGLQCWTAMQNIIGISSCLAMGRVTEAGIPVSCEVDILGALTMLIQYKASLEEACPHFIDWTIKHQEKENIFLAFHCGNAPTSLCNPKFKPVIREHFVLGKVCNRENTEGCCEFQLNAGKVTINRLVELKNKFRMLVTEGEIIYDPRKLRGSWSWIKVRDLDKLYRTIIEEGFIHHASIIHGEYNKAIKEFCKIMQVEIIEV